MIKALRTPSILQLWFGQLFSSVGDEIYRVGLVWLAVGILGPNTGLIVAGQLATLLLASFFGGKWADQYDPLTTMIKVDFLRGILVLIPVIVSFKMQVPIGVLIFVAFTVAGLSAFFDPAIQATLPILSKDGDTLLSANGLMSTTTRMARMIGPTLIGALIGIIPMIHFFTIDAITFFVSGISLIILMKNINYNKSEHIPLHYSSFMASIKAGLELSKRKKDTKYILFAKAVTSGTWNLAFNIGYALLVHQRTNGDAKSFSLLIASYGLGNFIGALIFGNTKRKNSRFMIFLGYFLLGFGFLATGLIVNFKTMLVAVLFTGFCGPLNDLSFIEHIQKSFNPKELTKIFRLRQSVETLAGLILMLLSPLLIKALSVSYMIVCIGIVWIITGCIGMIYDRRNLFKI